MPLRNPFKRSAPLEPLDVSHAEQGFDDASVSGIPEPVEHELSEINDSGRFIPPSASQRPGFWYTKSSSSSISSTTSSNHRISYIESEPFYISRESFDSFRRSFDISGRATVLTGDQILSSPEFSFIRNLSKSNSVEERRRADWPEEFEEVKLTDETHAPVHRKRGFFSRLVESSSKSSTKVEQDDRSLFGVGRYIPDQQESELKSMHREDELAGVIPTFPVPIRARVM